MKTYKALHLSIFIRLMMALMSATSVLAADLLNDPILVGGEISYTPPFAMPHSIWSDPSGCASISYKYGGHAAVSFQIMMFPPDGGRPLKEGFADTNVISTEVMRRTLQAGFAGRFIGTNVVAKIIKLDGAEAVEIYGKKKGYSGVPDMWTDTIMIIWRKGPTWSRSIGLLITVSDLNDEAVCQKLIESVKSAKYHPPK
ncbi:MAG: hypothetical protein WCH99_12305 [Verrucomicrobiota bacterium]